MDRMYWTRVTVARRFSALNTNKCRQGCMAQVATAASKWDGMCVCVEWNRVDGGNGEMEVLCGRHHVQTRRLDCIATKIRHGQVDMAYG